MTEAEFEGKFELVGAMLDHTLLGAQMLLRDAGDWDGIKSYGGRLYATTEYLRHAREEFQAAGEQRDTTVEGHHDFSR